MNKIQSIEDFCKLSSDEKTRLFEKELDRIEKYIYNSDWYKSKSKKIQKIIRTHKPWLLYCSAENSTPVRLFGFIEKSDEISFMVATMEDDEKNSLAIGQIQDINRIKPITWANINEKFISELFKANSYGGDVIFLKPEMFLILGG
jgi:hypothetical protein